MIQMMNVYNRKRDAWNMPMQHGVNLFNTIMLILKYNRLSIKHNNLNQDHIIIYLTKKPLQICVSILVQITIITIVVIIKVKSMPNIVVTVNTGIATRPAYKSST